MFVASGARETVFGFEVFLGEVINEGVEIGVGTKDNITTGAAVTAGGSAVGDEFFAAEGDATVSSGATLDGYVGFVCKVRHKQKEIRLEYSLAVMMRVWQELELMHGFMRQILRELGGIMRS